MPESNLQIRLAARPVGLPKRSDFEIVEEPVDEPGEGEVLVRQLYLSLDPAIRGWMADRQSYVPPIGLGEVMRGLGVGEVTRSRSDQLAVGDRVTGLLGWQRWAVVAADQLEPVPPGIDPKLVLGPLGMTGLTAYFGLLDIGEPREGDTVLVSAAAGAVGSMVGQLAKIEGCRAVGLAGSDAKCDWLRGELGYDAAINYKTAASLDEAIGEACPDGVDIYFDNVGGEILDTALRHLARGARVVICGAISIYNTTERPPGPSNYIQLLVRRARMEGFLVMDYRDRYAAAQAELGSWLAAGQLHYRFHVVQGLESAPEALNMLFDGSNEGKLVVEIG